METENQATNSGNGLPVGNSYGDLVRLVLEKDGLEVCDRVLLIDEIRKGNSHDRWGPRWAVWGLALVTIASVVTIGLLAGEGRNSEGLIAIGSAAVGGLAGLLTANHNNERPPPN